MVIQNAEKLSNQKKIDAIAPNSEKFISIGFDSLSVKDSFSFITASPEGMYMKSKWYINNSIILALVFFEKIYRFLDRLAKTLFYFLV